MASLFLVIPFTHTLFFFDHFLTHFSTSITLNTLK